VLDREIKDVLLFDTLSLINFGAVDRRRCIEEDRRRVKERLFAKQQDKKEMKYVRLRTMQPSKAFFLFSVFTEWHRRRLWGFEVPGAKCDALCSQVFAFAAF